MNVTVYDRATGRVIRSGQCVPGEYKNQRDDAKRQGLLAIACDPTLLYVVEGKPVPRPTLHPLSHWVIKADGDAVVSFPTPEGTTVWHNGAQYPLDGTFEFSTAEPGDYRFDFRCPFPYVNDFVLTVTARD